MKLTPTHSKGDKNVFFVSGKKYSFERVSVTIPDKVFTYLKSV